MRALHAAGVVAAAALSLAGCHASTQAPAAAVASAPVWKMPDWSGGLWVREPQNGDAPDIGQLRADKLPLTPQWRKKSDDLDHRRDTFQELRGNDSRCIPSGMPFMMIANPLEFLYSPGRIGILTGLRGLQIRNIFIDGRPHTKDDFLLDSFSGESIGHWEGDTLLVDTVGIRSSNELLYGLQATHMHVQERFHQSGPDQLQIETTVTDPQALAAPWVYTTFYTRHPDRFITDSVYCLSSLDRSVDPRTGKEGLDLTPPPEEGVGLPQSGGKR